MDRAVILSALRSEQLISVVEAGRRARLLPVWIRGWVEAGRLKAMDINGAMFVDAKRLARLVGPIFDRRGM